MNLESIQRAIERLNVLMAIKSDEEDDDDLALLLMGLFLTFKKNGDANEFKQGVISALEDSYRKVYNNQELIDQEISFQSGFLSKYILDWQNGRMSDAMAQYRIGLYADSLGKYRIAAIVEEEPERLFKWVYSAEAQHCNDCIMRNGQVKTGSAWRKLGLPRSGETACKLGCRCNIFPVSS